ncbi:MAG: hypothetical protein M1510_09255 [Nitrospirae bacterium]|nr:hypothetical protein [Nitrospirota bacterium]
MDTVSPIVSAIALCVSLLTAWFTIFRRGSVRSTHPSFVAFRYDFVGKEIPQAKIFLRTLLFSTGKRGWVIESLFLRVQEGERSEEFSFWGYGDKELVRGSGLFVSENGVVTNHHFNPLTTDTLFRFKQGTYKLELVAKLVGKEQLISLWSITVDIPIGAFDGSISHRTAVYFNWSPEQKSYIGTVEKRSGFIHALYNPQVNSASE